jgi:hypothetical protein
MDAPNEPNRGNAGMGRPKGSRNKLTLATLALVEDGESPCAFCIRVMLDESQDLAVRLNAARIAAPYLHSRPQPEGPVVEFEIPADVTTSAGLQNAHAAVLRLMAGGDISAAVAKDVSAVLETQRRLVETVQLEERIAALEGSIGKRGNA